MLDEQDTDAAAFPGPSYSAPPLPAGTGLPTLAPGVGNPNGLSHSMAPPPQQQRQQQQQQQQQSGAEGQQMINGGPAGFNGYDPILDADPFGLSASMHFPSQQFSYDRLAGR
jgi:hypothetical protein